MKDFFKKFVLPNRVITGVVDTTQRRQRRRRRRRREKMSTLVNSSMRKKPDGFRYFNFFVFFTFFSKTFVSPPTKIGSDRKHRLSMFFCHNSDNAEHSSFEWPI